MRILKMKNVIKGDKEGEVKEQGKNAESYKGKEDINKEQNE